MVKRKPYAAELYGGPRRRLKARVAREESNCWICGYPIDPRLDPKTDPMGRTVDEVIPRSRSVDPQRAALDRGNTRASHRKCNSEKGDRIITEERTSRDW